MSHRCSVLPRDTLGDLLIWDGAARCLDNAERLLTDLTETGGLTRW